MSLPAPIFDLPSRGVVRIAGPERVTFLNNLITNSVDTLQPGEAAYAALLTPQGKILFDFFVVETGDAYLLDCHGAFASDLVKRLSMYRLRAKVEITDVSGEWQVLAAPSAQPVETESRIVYADPRLHEMGARILVQRDSTIQATDDEAAYLALQLSHGLPNVPLDAGQGETFLLEANFDELHGVNFKKGCYIGQELAARMKHRATVRKRLVPVVSDGAMPAPGTEIKAGEHTAGELKSGVGHRALALLRLDRVEEAETLTAGETRLTIDWPNWFPK